MPFAWPQSFRNCKPSSRTPRSVALSNSINGVYSWSFMEDKDQAGSCFLLSLARGQVKVPVDYVLRKFLRKPKAGAVPASRGADEAPPPLQCVLQHRPAAWRPRRGDAPGTAPEVCPVPGA